MLHLIQVPELDQALVDRLNKELLDVYVACQQGDMPWEEYQILEHEVLDIVDMHKPQVISMKDALDRGLFA
jgi:hypothetical protein